MKIVFADSFTFFALLNPHEAPRAKAVAFAGIFEGTLVTTGWVLTEVADGMARPGNRELFLAIHHELQKRSGIRIVACCEELYQRGIEFYGKRLDKDWSLTDCISFLVMQDLSIAEALTGDHHYEQAGFVALLK